MTYWQALLRTWRYRLADALGRVRPRKLRFAVTKRCNSRCIMCSAWKTASPVVNEIAPDEIRSIAQRNRRFLSRVGHVSFTGGEPMLRHDLVELVRAAHEAFPRAAFNINTNGFDTRRTVAAVNEVIQFHRRLTVMVSLDGIGEAHNVVRGAPRVFPRVAETIDQLVGIRERGAKLTVEVNFVLTNRNSDQMLPVFHFCRERGIAFNPIYPVYGQLYENDEAEIGLERHAARRFLADLAEIQRIDRSLALQELGHQLEGRPRDYDCWAGRALFFIESDCRVFPNGGCPPAFCLGGLRDFGYSFGGLLRSPQARGVLARLRKCRLCRLPCETMTTLNGPEALAGYRKTFAPPTELTVSAPASSRTAQGPSRQRMF
ncbi:radical SAM protein [Candidatus Sumerlaeota bacterium]|nr:radical SAM protein [Candidatus Sumerlaeota bacterium]